MILDGYHENVNRVYSLIHSKSKFKDKIFLHEFKMGGL